MQCCGSFEWLLVTAVVIVMMMVTVVMVTVPLLTSTKFERTTESSIR